MTVGDGTSLHGAFDGVQSLVETVGEIEDLWHLLSTFPKWRLCYALGWDIQWPWVCATALPNDLRDPEKRAHYRSEAD